MSFEPVPPFGIQLVIPSNTEFNSLWVVCKRSCLNKVLLAVYLQFMSESINIFYMIMKEVLDFHLECKKERKQFKLTFDWLWGRSVDSAAQVETVEILITAAF